MENIVTTSQQPTPLNLKYKGVFSTRVGSNDCGYYGHYLDKLYRIKFLGIGTFGAIIETGIISTALVKHASITGEVGEYKATPDKFKESLTLETLGVLKSPKETASVEFTVGDRINKVKVSTVTEILSFDKLVQFGLINEAQAASLKRKADILEELEASSNRHLKEAILEELNEALKNKEMALPEELLFSKNRILDAAEIEAENVGKVAHPVDVIEYVETDKGRIIEAGVDGGEVKAENKNADKEFYEVVDTILDKVAKHVENADDTQQTGTVKRTNVILDFEHEIVAEETKIFKAVLDNLYGDFVKMRDGEVGEISEAVKVISNYALVDETLEAELDKVKEATINEVIGADRLSLKDVEILSDERLDKPINKVGEVLDAEQGEMWNEDPVFVSDSRDEEYHAELTSEDGPLSVFKQEDVFGELHSEEVVLSHGVEEEHWAELTSEQETLTYAHEAEDWAGLTSEDEANVVSYEPETWAELSSEQEPLYYFPDEPMQAEKVKLDEHGKIVNDYDIAVLGCSDPDLKYRRRPDLKPDPKPEDPLFEWVCTEGYVCDDWLIVPLRDFNFENMDGEGFYDPSTLQPYFPTGQVDENGDPYVLPPYSILNEPISNGADVGGKEPMSIDPCNLYSFIEYVVKIYDAYKTRFIASTPIDSMSRVMNMLYDQVVKLINEYDGTQGYTPDGLWRIYRFIRWIALGTTNRFYRVKLVYTYGDFVENFNLLPISDLITADGASVKIVNPYGFVMEGHPTTDDVINKVMFDFDLPLKTRSSTITFEIGNVVPDRPATVEDGGVYFSEDFEGLQSNFKIKGNGWGPVPAQGSTGLGIVNKNRGLYSTTTFTVPANALNPVLEFNYGIDSNMDTNLRLMKDGAEVWKSHGNDSYGYEHIQPADAGEYRFEVNVPQSAGGGKQDIEFSAQRIQDEWDKVGYQTEWKVEGNTIYEEENTPRVAMVVNPQWSNETDYEMEVEFFTADILENYALIDWIGIVLNYQDENNHYLFGTWSRLDTGAYGGLLHVVNGQNAQEVASPTWRINPDFRFQLGVWHKLRAVVKVNEFQIFIDGVRYLHVIDHQGWGGGACGLATFSNPMSYFRNFKFKSTPRINAFIDNVKITTDGILTPAPKPKYTIDFYLDGSTPRVQDYSQETKRTYSFPIMDGEHKARWEFSKYGNIPSVVGDASFVDNIVVKGMKPIKVDVEEEFIGCGGHLAVKLLIENLLEYYRRHHQGCKGERNIWIIE